MSPAAKRTWISYAEYLALEASSSERWAWYDGEVWAMAGGTPTHSEISTNVTVQLGVLLRGRPCRPYNADLRVRVEATGLAFHPDVTVICGPRTLHPEDADAVTNPTVLVEVLSRSTEAYDRREKAHHYRLVPTLRDYLYLSQAEPRVEHYHRNDDGTWTLRDLRSGDAVDLVSLGVSLAVDDVYAEVSFGQTPA